MRTRLRWRGVLLLLVCVGVGAACSGERPELIGTGEISTGGEATTSAPDATMVEQPAIVRADCVTATGPGPWKAVIEATPDPAVPCALLAAHQRIEFVNNTADQVSFDLARGTVTVEPAASLVTEPAGTILQPGLTTLAAAPHPVPGLWLVDATENTLAGQQVGLGGIGPVTIGLAPAEVTAALGGSPVVASGADCYVSHIDGDPYSPLFTVQGGTVAVIQVFTPDQLTRSSIGIGSLEGDILAAYGQQIESQPSPDGNADRKLLVFVPNDEADRVHRLVFVMENDMVVGLRNGLADPAVAQPGCPEG